MSAAGTQPDGPPPLGTKATPEKRPQRLPGLDGLKGVAIVLVVIIHAAPLSDGLWIDWVVQGIARLAVPTFLLVSGFLHSLRATSRSRLLSHAGVFLRLHLIWGMVHATADALDPAVSLSWDPRSLLLHFGAGAWAGQFFLLVLVQLLLGAALLGSPRRWGSPLIVVLSAMAWAAGVGFVMAWKTNADLPGALELLGRARSNPGWLWFFYFALGGWVARLELPRRFQGRWTLPSAGLAILVLAGAPLPPTGEESWAASFPYLQVSILAACTLLALATPVLASLPAPAWLCSLGRHSFALFVLNPLLLRLLYGIGGRPEDALTSLGYVALTLLAGIALSRWMIRRLPFLLP